MPNQFGISICAMKFFVIKTSDVAVVYWVFYFCIKLYNPSMGALLCTGLLLDKKLVHKAASDRSSFSSKRCGGRVRTGGRGTSKGAEINSDLPRILSRTMDRPRGCSCTQTSVSHHSLSPISVDARPFSHQPVRRILRYAHQHPFPITQVEVPVHTPNRKHHEVLPFCTSCASRRLRYAVINDECRQLSNYRNLGSRR